mmetsp:Transcript_96465/g.277061  ORF Transcript_96465/g.277061 Transcript_96465/m.277061 type:complete len:201 (-) Transcript_96465:156-758(-)
MPRQRSSTCNRRLADRASARATAALHAATAATEARKRRSSSSPWPVSRKKRSRRRQAIQIWKAPILQLLKRASVVARSAAMHVLALKARRRQRPSEAWVTCRRWLASAISKPRRSLRNSCTAEIQDLKATPRKAPTSALQKRWRSDKREARSFEAALYAAKARRAEAERNSRKAEAAARPCTASRLRRTAHTCQSISAET